MNPAAGRLVLAAGGVATVLVAAFPVPRDGTSDAHRVPAGIGFVTLALWPVFAARRGRSTPPALRAPPSWAAAAVLVVLLAWFVVELFGAQSLWPLVVVVVTTVARRGRPR